MRLSCAVTGLMLVLLTAVASAESNGPLGNDPAPGTSCNLKNAPFSADVVTEYDRTVGNGGRIHRESRGKIYRDSQGRIRTESQPPAVQPGSERYDRITINDPIQQVMIYLNPKTRTATILHFGEVGPTAPLTSAKQSKLKQSAKISLGAQPAIGSGPADTLATPNVPGEQANLPSTRSVPPSDMSTSNMEATPSNNSGKATIVSLGTRTIAGLNATGTRTTRTIDAGTMGTEGPVVSITDNWVSSDLKVTLLTDTDDGQAGHSTRRLENIVRSEPNPALFLIPPDYTVKQNTTAVSTKR